MALLHRAEITPTKLELVAVWVARQEWLAGVGVAIAFSGAASSGGMDELETIGSYRFDDPDGEVGIETLLVRSGGGPVLQVPLTYRGAPLDTAEDWLVGTMEHSVLGRRWVYDALGDPAYLSALAATVLEGGTEAAQYHEVEGERVYREPTARVVGSGGRAADGDAGAGDGGGGAGDGGGGEFPEHAEAPTDESPCVKSRQEGAITVSQAGGLRVALVRLLEQSGKKAAGDAGAEGSGEQGETVSVTAEHNIDARSLDALTTGDGPGLRGELRATWVGQPEPVVVAAVVTGGRYQA